MDRQSDWSPPRMGTREFRALNWLSFVEPPAGIVVPPTAWLPAARASGLKVPAIKRLARRAADGGDPRVAWYGEHLARLRRRAVKLYRERLASGDTIPRARKAYRLRERGEEWAGIARRVGYASARSAREMAKRYAERAGLPWPVVPTG